MSVDCSQITSKANICLYTGVICQLGYILFVNHNAFDTFIVKTSSNDKILICMFVFVWLYQHTSYIYTSYMGLMGQTKTSHKTQRILLNLDGTSTDNTQLRRSVCFSKDVFNRFNFFSLVAIAEL